MGWALTGRFEGSFDREVREVCKRCHSMDRTLWDLHFYPSCSCAQRKAGEHGMT